MEGYILEFSKYVLTICMALYTYECFAVFRYSGSEDRNGIYIRQNLLMFFFHTVGFLTLYVKNYDITYLFLCAFELIILFAVVVLFRSVYPRVNRLTVNNMCMLLSIGFIILARLSLVKAGSQFKIVIISLAFGLAVPFFVRQFKFLKNLTWIYASVGLVALSIVLLVGAATNGSKISYSLFGFTFQPSEFVKVLFVFFTASLLYDSERFVKVAVSAVIAALHVLILVLSKDLGSALIFFVVYISMLFVATKNYIYLFLGVGSGAGAAALAFKLFSHVQVRVQAWQNPWDDMTGRGYQITQSLFAIGTGSWFGMGLGNGAPTSIPYVETDFVFSAIAEEMGVIFAICLILVCVSCFMMFMNIAMKIKDKFYQLLAVGLGVTYAFQVFLTIGGGTKFIPLTGVTLPFISYGGSSVLTTIVMFSIIQGLYIIRKDVVTRAVESSLPSEGEYIEENKGRRKSSKKRKTQEADFEEE